MQSVLRLVLIDPCTASRESLKRLIADMDSVWIEGECHRYDQYSAVFAEAEPDIALFALDSDLNQALALVSETVRLGPRCRILVSSCDGDGQRILQAMRAGAHEYLTQPVQLDDLLAAFERARQFRTARSGGSHAESVVWAVTGAVGGVGCTALAVNLSVALAANPNRRVVLLDLDMVLGDADVCLDLVHHHTLYDVTCDIARLDFTLLKRSLVRHSCGLSFLPHPTSVGESSDVSPAAVKRLLTLLRATFTHVVLDLSKGFRETDIAAMQSADTVLVVGQLDVASLRNMSRLIKTLDPHDDHPERMKLVLNRVGSRDMDIDLSEAEQSLGRKATALIPNDWTNFASARNNGVPLVLQAPKSKAAQAIATLAETLCGSPAGAGAGAKPSNSTPRRRGLFSRLVGST
jgi:pilus assembly protein CpaE